MRFHALIACAAILLLLTSPPAEYAHAQEPTPPAGLVMTATAGINGIAREGAWTAVTISLENQGDPIRGEVVIATSGGFVPANRVSAAVELPHQSRKQVTLYTHDTSTFSQKIIVQLLDEDGRLLAEADAPVRIIAANRLIVGVWSDDPAFANSLSGIMTPAGAAIIAPLTADHLPAQEMGWRVMDCLITARTDTSVLEPGQRDALARWVSGGGHLILVGGSSPDGMMSGLSEYSPLRTLRTEMRLLAPLGIYAGSPLPEDSEAIVTIGQALDGAEVLVESDDTPLAATWKWGAGRVSFLAADPLLAPLAGWQAMPEVWRALMANASPSPGWSFGFNDDNTYNIVNAVSAIPGVELIGIGPLLLFLLAYLLVIGPLNYLLVTHLKKRELSWFTIPVIITLFSGAAYFVGFSLRGGDLLIHRLSVIHTYPETDTARVNALLGVWSPRRRAYDISLEQGYFAERLGEPYPSSLAGTTGTLDIVMEEGITLRDEIIDASSLRSYELAGTLSDAPRIEGDLALRYEDGRLLAEGEIVNYSVYDLTDATLFYLGQMVRIEDIPAGEAVMVDAVLQSSSSYQRFSMRSGLLPAPLAFEQYYYVEPILRDMIAARTDCDMFTTDMDDDRRQCDVTSSIFTSGDINQEAYLFGWMEVPVFDVSIADATMKTYDKTLLIAGMRSTFDSPRLDSAESIPTEFISSEVLDSRLSGGYSAAYGFYLEPGDWVVLGLRSILPTRGAFNQITVSINFYGSASTADVTFYNWQTGSWDPITLSPTGLATVTGTHYFGPDGTVRVRFANPEDAMYNIEAGNIEVSFHREEEN